MGDIYEANWQISVDGVVSTVNMHYEQDQGGDSPTICQSAGAAISDNCLVPFQNILAQDARIEALYVRKVTGTTRPAWQGNFQAANGTAIGTDAMSAQNCLLVNLRNLAGELKRSGRWFISGCPKVSVIDGIWLDTYVNVTVQAWLDTVLNIPIGGTDGWTGALRVMRTVIGGVKQDPPIPVTVDGLDVTLELGTQMKRKGVHSGYAVDVDFPV